MQNENLVIPTDEWAVQVKAGVDPKKIADQYNMVYLGKVGSLKDIYLFRRPGVGVSSETDPLLKDSRVLWLERQVKVEQQKKPVVQQK